jgi:aspartate/methionine/tyrosine aminotransferase
MPAAACPSDRLANSDGLGTLEWMGELPGLSRTALGVRASVFADLAPRIAAHAERGGDLIELHLGDTHLAPPDEARFSRADDDPFDRALYRYGSISGLSALKDAFAAYLVARGLGPPAIEPARHVLVGCGATHAIFCTARAVLDPGDEVLVAAPYWPLSVGVLRAAGANPIEVPLTNRLYAEPSLDAGAVLAEALTPATRAIYFITPNNPDGKVLTNLHLAQIARLALARGLWVIADEVYADYAYDGVHGSIARTEGMAGRTISVYSLSKSHALAGARIGFAVAPERVIELARRIATHTVFNVPVAAQRVALAALAAPATWTHEARAAYREARDATMRALDGSGAHAFTPDGGSYVFLDFAPVLGGRPLRVLLERAIDRGVLLAPGEGFGEAYSTWARLCFTAVPRARLLEGIARLRAAIVDIAR